MKSTDRANQLFTTEELASYLRLKPLTVCKHASCGRIPGFKIGPRWRFKRQTIENWIETRFL